MFFLLGKGMILLQRPLPPWNRMAKLSGVEIIIIIGVGFAVFVILFIVAHRQIARFKVRDLLSRPLLKHSQFGASLGFVTKIQRDIAGVLDIDVQPQMWDDHWNTFFKSQSAPGYVYRAKALDFTVLLKLELLKFGTQFDWTAFEDLGEYFDRLKMEYPINKLPVETVTDFLHIYRRCRFDDTEFSEREHDKMNKLVTGEVSLPVSYDDLTATSEGGIFWMRRIISMVREYSYYLDSAWYFANRACRSDCIFIQHPVAQKRGGQQRALALSCQLKPVLRMSFIVTQS